ncbi:MAG: NAD-dependent epimerase/dehydratase family protein [Proteobacteria bacterium]|nr:NAD-dependent epimerase/dehydratase family protein [Pseudomonadota bacterium]
MVLLQVTAEANVKQLVFNSSATVFGANPQVQYTEYLPIGAVNPYV